MNTDLQGKAVVASHVRLEPPHRALIVSGPNGGGKTVTITAVGLAACMLRAGLPVAAAEGSRLPLFAQVFAAVEERGDLAARRHVARSPRIDERGFVVARLGVMMRENGRILVQTAVAELGLVRLRDQAMNPVAFFHEERLVRCLVSERVLEMVRALFVS